MSMTFSKSAYRTMFTETLWNDPYNHMIYVNQRQLIKISLDKVHVAFLPYLIPCHLWNKICLNQISLFACISGMLKCMQFIINSKVLIVYGRYEKGSRWKYPYVFVWSVCIKRIPFILSTILAIVNIAYINYGAMFRP